MMTRRLPKVHSALPFVPNSEGRALCDRFCRLFGRPPDGQRHGPRRALRIPHRLRLKDGPYLCLMLCKSFAKTKPVKISRPRIRASRIIRTGRKETKR